jgi:hypothetical protein
MKTSLKSIALTLCLPLAINAQVAQTSIVEHFTNTSCGVCAGTNPGIYTNLNANPNVLHISFHPSSPYTSDVFSLQNKAENDARTMYYSIFGSTPRTVLNGVAIPASTLGTALPATSILNSNYSLKATQVKVGSTGFDVTVVVTKKAADTNTSAILFAGVAQDTVAQATNNGEQQHFNVFRKALTMATGNAVTLPVNVGDSIILNYSYTADATWPLEKLSTIAILQRQNKIHITAAKSTNVVAQPNSIINTIEVAKVISAPNPSNGIITILHNCTNIVVLNLKGEVVYSSKNVASNSTINISKMPKGKYFIKALINSKWHTQQIAVN